ncbi:MAG: fused response regulator/phosphatase [Planctomycetes bacterium]|jgi:sigma-B regulation protein RsbU (phosphoserine phosphatase)|nr:fused response regulator/phosphatase [Planctomycetota bacterium]
MAHLILISNDAALSGSIEQDLKAGKHTISVAPDTEKALAAAQSMRPDLMICDLQESGEKEIQFLESLQKDRKLMRVPIILLVEGKNYTAILGGYQCDIYGILKKPVDIEHLGVQVETVLRQTVRNKQSRRRERSELQSQILRLEREISATTADLTDAAQNFVTMLASPPSPKGIRINCHFAPAGGFVGGDFYDFFWLDRRRLAVVVGDVTGHGIQAAVIQSMARKVISIGTRIHNGDLREALRFANEEIAPDMPHGKFVAGLVGVLDTISGDWAHARCGVPHPVLQQPDGSIQEIVTAGLALGLKRSPNWADTVEVFETNLMPGARLILFSDGILECKQEDGEEFDYPGMRRALSKIPSDVDVAHSIANIAQAGHRAEDDVLIISITREGVDLIEGEPEDETSYTELSRDDALDSF